MTAPFETRFWAKVVKTDGCWKWTGSKHPFGYGMIRAGGMRNKMTASRASWLIHFGPIPDGMYICHHCDNPECTNPKHLFLGTPQDNCVDKEEKGRGRRLLSQDQNDAVVTLLSAGVTQRLLARAFRVDRKVITNAINYGNIIPLEPEKSYYKPGPPKPKVPPPVMRGELNNKAKLTAADVLRIRAMREEGLSTGEIAEHFAVGKSMVSHICTRRCWKHI